MSHASGGGGGGSDLEEEQEEVKELRDILDEWNKQLIESRTTLFVNRSVGLPSVEISGLVVGQRQRAKSFWVRPQIGWNIEASSSLRTTRELRDHATTAQLILVMFVHAKISYFVSTHAFSHTRQRFRCSYDLH